MMDAPPVNRRIIAAPPAALPTIMKTPSYLAATICGLALVSASCRKTKNPDATNSGQQDVKVWQGPVTGYASPEATTSGPPEIIAPDLQSNRLGTLPGAIYHNQAGSPIHWQPWTNESLQRAKEAKRLVFAVVAMPQHPGFQGVLAALAHNPRVVDAIHSHYVPVLIDGDAAREIGLLTADLSAEIKKPLQLPMFMWMTHEGNPVAWIPVSTTDPTGVVDLFDHSHATVSKMWADEPDYVLTNSSQDNANRRRHMAMRKNAKVMSTEPATEAVYCIRQLASLYDPYTRSFDGVGGLFPSGAIELLATAAIHPGLPPDVRSRAMETTRELMVDLLPSAMFDPLDGGVFPSRRSGSWALPSFCRNCPAQARVAVALIQVYRATGDPQTLAKALGLIAFTEKAYTTPEGLFAVGLTRETPTELWMWKLEDVEKALPPEDAAWWIKATGMKSLGNLPPEADPRCEFFRCNTLSLTQSVADIAAAQGQTLEAFTPRFEAVKTKLLAIRNERLGDVPRDDESHAGATFRMVSAYAAAFGATGDEIYRKKAVDLLGRAQKAFAVGTRLRNFSTDAPASIGAGRDFLYALALQAVIDVATISSDDHWLDWSEDLATTSAELFTSNEFLKECPDDAKLIDLPVTDLVMLFDDSTAGLISSAECRLAELGRPLVKSFSELATPMPVYARDKPVLHTDLVLATMARHFHVTVVLGADIPPALKLATERLQMRVIQHRPARAEDQVPAGSVKVLLPRGECRMVSSLEALQEAVLPSPAK